MIAFACVAMRLPGSHSPPVEARSSVRDRLRREGVDHKLGGINRFSTVAAVVDNLQKST